MVIPVLTIWIVFVILNDDDHHPDGAIIVVASTDGRGREVRRGPTTGSLAWLVHPDGALTIVGRRKELIIRSGLNVYPVEVEQAINAHPEVIQSAVVGRTVQHNEAVVAFVERAAGSAPDYATLRAHLCASLAPYKIPSEIRFLSPLPAAPTGKLIKGVMKTMAQQPADASPAPAMP